MILLYCVPYQAHRLLRAIPDAQRPFPKTGLTKWGFESKDRDKLRLSWLKVVPTYTHATSSRQIYICPSNSRYNASEQQIFCSRNLPLPIFKGLRETFEYTYLSKNVSFPLLEILHENLGTNELGSFTNFLSYIKWI